MTTISEAVHSKPQASYELEKFSKNCRLTVASAMSLHAEGWAELPLMIVKRAMIL